MRRLEVAKTELDEIEKEMVSVKSGLGGRKAQLTSQEKQLKVRGSDHHYQQR